MDDPDALRAELERLKRERALKQEARMAAQREEELRENRARLLENTLTRKLRAAEQEARRKAAEQEEHILRAALQAERDRLLAEEAGAEAAAALKLQAETEGKWLSKNH